MSRALQIGFAVVLLLLVLAVFVSPAVNLLPSALRSVHLAILLWTLLTFAALVFSLFDIPALMWTTYFSGRRFASPLAVSLMDLNCTRLC